MNYKSTNSTVMTAWPADSLLGVLPVLGGEVVVDSGLEGGDLGERAVGGGVLFKLYQRIFSTIKARFQ